MSIRKKAAAVLTVFIFQVFVFSGIVCAEDATTFGINIGSSEVQGWIDVQFDTNDIPLVMGADILYNNDDGRYWLTSAHIAVKDELLMPQIDLGQALSLGLGFRGVLGEVKIHRADYDVGAFCFQFLGDYDFRKNSSPGLPSFFGLPVSISLSLSGAPEILCFSDTEKYVEFSTAFNFYINKSAAAFIGYRRIDIDFDRHDDKNWDDDAVFAGIRISF